MYKAIELNSTDDRINREEQDIFLGVWLKQWLKFIQPVPHASFANTENKKSALKSVLDMYKRNSNGLYSDNIQSHAIHEIAK